MRYLYFLITLTIFFSCAGTNVQKNYKKSSSIENLPGVISINDSLTIDRNEISNIAWKEYMHHNLVTYGEFSDQYQSTLLKKDIYVPIKGIDGEDSIALRLYIDRYDMHPVVGVSLDQAKDYARWRSERVFEMMLVSSRMKKLEHANETKKMYSLDDYLKSPIATQYRDLVTHYPEYYIPTTEEYNAALEYILSKDIILIDSETSQVLYEETRLPMVKLNYEDKKKINHLLGNVSELTSQDGISFGGSYKNSQQEILRETVRKESTPSNHVGFRNFFRWVKINYNEPE